MANRLPAPDSPTYAEAKRYAPEVTAVLDHLDQAHDFFKNVVLVGQHAGILPENHMQLSSQGAPQATVQSYDPNARPEVADSGNNAFQQLHRRL
jgi:hypothetical protein